MKKNKYDKNLVQYIDTRFFNKKTNKIERRPPKKKVKNKQNNNVFDISNGLEDKIKTISELDLPGKKDDKFPDMSASSRHQFLEFIKPYIKSDVLPPQIDKYLCDKPKKISARSAIRIRKLKSYLNTCHNPLDDYDNDTKMCLRTLTVSEIHPQKFIMLSNKVIYDIELLISYVVNRYHEKETYNLDPEYQIHPIWESDADVAKILSHGLIKKPGKLASHHYLYEKATYLENVDIFKKIIHEDNVNQVYFGLFEKYPHFLIQLNSIGAIFHIEQPTSYFNPDSIVFKDIKGLDDNNHNIIIERLMDIIRLEHMDYLTNSEIKDVATLQHKIYTIVTEYEYLVFSQIVEELGIVLTNSQLKAIINNVARMMAFSINFNEGSQAKIKFGNYINQMDNKNKKIAMELVNNILSSQECIHRQGSQLRCLFTQWWFKYLGHLGISQLDIISKYIPITYREKKNELDGTNDGTNDSTSDSINDNLIMASNRLLGSFSEKNNGYHLVICPNHKVPCWYYKMGEIDRWDGINLNNFSFCCRLCFSPYDK